MSYKKMSMLSVFCFLTVVHLSAVSYAGDNAAKKTVAVELKAVEETFAKDFPNTTIREVKQSGIEGLYEITAGSTVFYYHPRTSRVLFGDLVTKDFKNITAERRKEAEISWKTTLALRLNDLPLDKAIKIGSGKHIVVEFVDIDCPYCRQIESFFKQRNDVTRYVFIFPLESIHPNSAKKATAVLCSKNREEAFVDAMAGKLDSGEIKTCNDNKVAALLKEHKEVARTMEITGTPSLWIDKNAVKGADVTSMEALLSDRK
jgi:thiol:disulfide interchange protein DsbC